MMVDPVSANTLVLTGGQFFILGPPLFAGQFWKQLVSPVQELVCEQRRTEYFFSSSEGHWRYLIGSSASLDDVLLG